MSRSLTTDPSAPVLLAPTRLAARLAGSPRGALAAALLAPAALFALATALDPLVRATLGDGARAHGLYLKLTAVNIEQSVPTWYNAVLLLAVAVFSFAIAHRLPPAHRDRLGFFALAGAFAYLSIDESVSIHEMTSGTFRRALGLSGPLLYGWVVPAAACLLVFALLMYRFWRRQPAPLRLGLALAAAVYVSGAMGMEMVGAALADLGQRFTFTYRLAQVVEEFLEMAGVALALCALTFHPAAVELARLWRRTAPA